MTTSIIEHENVGFWLKRRNKLHLHFFSEELCEIDFLQREKKSIETVVMV